MKCVVKCIDGLDGVNALKLLQAVTYSKPAKVCPLTDSCGQ